MADISGREQSLVKGLRKAVADPEVEWLDANIARLLLGRYDEAASDDGSHAPLAIPPRAGRSFLSARQAAFLAATDAGQVPR